MRTASLYRLKLASASTLGVVSLMSAAVMALAVATPQLRLPGFDRVGIGAEARANLAAAAPTPASDALTINHASLNAAPMNAAGWMRIAYLKTRTGAPLDAEGRAAIEKSYAVAPFGPDLTAWRLSFLYEHWSQLTPDIRSDVSEEHVAMARARGPLFDPNSVVDPSGRMAANLNHFRAYHQ